MFAPDHRGHGRSEHVGTGGFYHFWDYVRDVDRLCEYLSPHQPVDLIGHSMGGTIACLFAGARPERIHRLVVVEGLGPEDTTHQAVRQARQFLRHTRTPRVHTPLSGIEDAVHRMRFHNPALSPNLARSLAERMSDKDGKNWAWDPKHRARSPTPFSENQFRVFLREITAPTLVVWGGKRVFPGHHRVADLRDHRVETIPSAGHLVHHDAPTALAERIEAHLA